MLKKYFFFVNLILLTEHQAAAPLFTKESMLTLSIDGQSTQCRENDEFTPNPDDSSSGVFKLESITPNQNSLTIKGQYKLDGEIFDETVNAPLIPLPLSEQTTLRDLGITFDPKKPLSDFIAELNAKPYRRFQLYKWETQSWGDDQPSISIIFMGELKTLRFLTQANLNESISRTADCTNVYLRCALSGMADETAVRILLHTFHHQSIPDNTVQGCYYVSEEGSVHPVVIHKYCVGTPEFMAWKALNGNAVAEADILSPPINGESIGRISSGQAVDWTRGRYIRFYQDIPLARKKPEIIYAKTPLKFFLGRERQREIRQSIQPSINPGGAMRDLCFIEPTNIKLDVFQTNSSIGTFVAGYYYKLVLSKKIGGFDTQKWSPLDKGVETDGDTVILTAGTMTYFPFFMEYPTKTGTSFADWFDFVKPLHHFVKNESFFSPYYIPTKDFDKLDLTQGSYSTALGILDTWYPSMKVRFSTAVLDANNNHLSAILTGLLSKQHTVQSIVIEDQSKKLTVKLANEILTFIQNKGVADITLSIGTSDFLRDEVLSGFKTLLFSSNSPTFKISQQNVCLGDYSIESCIQKDENGKKFYDSLTSASHFSFREMDDSRQWPLTRQAVIDFIGRCQGLQTLDLSNTYFAKTDRAQIYQAIEKNAQSLKKVQVYNTGVCNIRGTYLDYDYDIFLEALKKLTCLEGLAIDLPMVGDNLGFVSLDEKALKKLSDMKVSSFIRFYDTRPCFFVWVGHRSFYYSLLTLNRQCLTAEGTIEEILKDCAPDICLLTPRHKINI